MIPHSLLVLVLLTSAAIAQPGATPPTEPPAPTGVQIGNNRLETDLDALIRKAQAEAPTIETVARGTFRRARRALLIGPTVGFWRRLRDSLPRRVHEPNIAEACST